MFPLCQLCQSSLPHFSAAQNTTEWQFCPRSHVCHRQIWQQPFLSHLFTLSSSQAKFLSLCFSWFWFFRPICFISFRQCTIFSLSLFPVTLYVFSVSILQKHTFSHTLCLAPKYKPATGVQAWCASPCMSMQWWHVVKAVQWKLFSKK